MRIEFTSAAKEIIARRAGYRCSFPECDKSTVASGAKPNEVANTGVAAHIYSASEKGPRGQINLTADELKNPDNGICGYVGLMAY